MSIMISAIGVSYLLQKPALYVTGGLNKNYPSIPLALRHDPHRGRCHEARDSRHPDHHDRARHYPRALYQPHENGIAMRAVSRDFETAQLMGIKIDSVISMTFVIGSLLAAIGSMLYFTNYPGVVPTSGAMPGLKCFVAAVFGGIGSIPGARSLARSSSASMRTSLRDSTRCSSRRALFPSR